MQRSRAKKKAPLNWTWLPRAAFSHNFFRHNEAYEAFSSRKVSPRANRTWNASWWKMIFRESLPPKASHQKIWSTWNFIYWQVFLVLNQSRFVCIDGKKKKRNAPTFSTKRETFSFCPTVCCIQPSLYDCSLRKGKLVNKWRYCAIRVPTGKLRFARSARVTMNETRAKWLKLRAPSFIIDQLVCKCEQKDFPEKPKTLTTANIIIDGWLLCHSTYVNENELINSPHERSSNMFYSKLHPIGVSVYFYASHKCTHQFPAEKIDRSEQGNTRKHTHAYLYGACV